MATGYDVYVYIIYGHRAISCIGHRRGAKDKAVQRLYGDRTEIVRGRREIVRFLRGYSYISTEIVQRSCDSRTEAVRRPQGEGIFIECHLRCV